MFHNYLVNVLVVFLSLRQSFFARFLGLVLYLSIRNYDCSSQEVDPTPWVGLMPGNYKIYVRGLFHRIYEKQNGYGLAPDIQSSDQTEINSVITVRSRNFMRSLLIESSWIAIRVDPALTAKYGNLVKRMKANKAIIRIAKSLLSRIRYVWLNQKPY